MNRAQKLFRCRRLCDLAFDQVLYHDLKQFIDRSLTWHHLTLSCALDCRLIKAWHLFNGDGALGQDLLPLEVQQKRIETSVLRNDVEKAGRISFGKDTEVVCDVKVERVMAPTLEHDVFGAVTQWLNAENQFTRQLQVLGTEKDADSKVLILQQSERLDLHILEVDQH